MLKFSCLIRALLINLYIKLCSDRMTNKKNRIITLLTDFGLDAPYAAAMKGVILAINPEAKIIDISHQITSHDIIEASFVLMTSYSYFSPHTIHLIVVDPGVGSQRRAILMQTEKYFFIAPDNGVLSYPLRSEKVIAAVEITNTSYFLESVSSTFHGRDIFAPVAAWLSRGVKVQEFGPEIKDIHRISFPPVKKLNKNTWRAEVLYIDKFGNVITNIDKGQWQQLQAESQTSSFALQIGGMRITSLADNYLQGKSQKLSALFGSSNFLEISSYCQSAARKLKVRRGDTIEITFR
jgi:S-adenosylmethionine hydrolase